jgi:hypothetical protein
MFPEGITGQGQITSAQFDITKAGVNYAVGPAFTLSAITPQNPNQLNIIKLTADEIALYKSIGIVFTPVPPAMMLYVTGLGFIALVGRRRIRRNHA